MTTGGGVAPLRVQVTDTAADTDALSGTDLEAAPFRGLLEIWVASTVNTATLTLTVGGVLITRSMAVSLRTNGVPNVNEDTPIAQVGVLPGEKIAVNIGGTTGTVYTIARLTPL